MIVEVKKNEFVERTAYLDKLIVEENELTLQYLKCKSMQGSSFEEFSKSQLVARRKAVCEFSLGHANLLEKTLEYWESQVHIFQKNDIQQFYWCITLHSKFCALYLYSFINLSLLQATENISEEYFNSEEFWSLLNSIHDNLKEDVEVFEDTFDRFPQKSIVTKNSCPEKVADCISLNELKKNIQDLLNRKNLSGAFLLTFFETSAREAKKLQFLTSLMQTLKA